MDDSYFFFGLVYFASLAVAVGIIGIERLLNPTRMIGLYFIVFTLTYFVRPLLTYLLGDTRNLAILRIAGLERSAVEMSIGSALALIGVAIGYRISVGANSSTKPNRPWMLTSKQYRYLKYLCVILLIVGYLSTILGGPVPGISSTDVEMLRTDGGTVYTNTTGYFIVVNIYVAASTLLIFAMSGKPMAPIVLSLPWLITRFYIGWGRATYLFYLVALLVVWMLMKQLNLTSRKYAIPVVGLVVLGLALVPVIGANRYYFRNEAFSIVGGLVDTARGWIDADSSLAGFEPTLYMFQLVPQPYSHTLGAPWVYRYFIQWIPRILWTEKPVPSDLIGWVDSSLYGAAPGAIGEAYLNFGFLGIIGVFVITGLIIGLVEKTFFRSERTPALICAYATFYATMIHLGRNTLITMLPAYAIQWGVPFLIAYWIEARAAKVGPFQRLAPLKRYARVG